MKNLLVIFSLLVLFSFTNVCAQTSPSESEYYRVHTIKYKHGKEKEATKIGTKFFSNSLQKLGITVKVLKFESGPWDLLVIAPVSSDSPFVDAHSAEMGKIMTQIAGDDVQLKKELDKYNSFVLREDFNYFKNLNESVLDASTTFRTRHIKFHQGMKKQGTDIGSTYFTGALNELGINILVLQAKTGAYDLMIVEPVPTDSPFKSPHAKQFSENMLEIAGSSEELSSAMKGYNEAVLIEDIHYLTGID